MRVGRWRIALWVAIVLIALVFLYLVRGVLLPFGLAFAISAVLHPLVNRLRRRGWPAWLAIGSIFAIFFGSLVLLGIFLTPVVSKQIAGFKDRVDDLAAGFSQPDEDSNFFVRWNPVVVERSTRSHDLVDSVLESQGGTLARLGLPTTKRALYAQYVEPQRGGIDKTVRNFLQGFVGIASGLLSQVLVLLFVPLLVLLILPNWDGLKTKLFNLVPPGIRPGTVAMLGDIGDVFSKYLRGVSIAVGGYMLVMGLLLSLLGAPYGLLLGFLFGLVYLIPYLNVAICGTVLFAVTMLSGENSGYFLHMASPAALAFAFVGIYIVVHFVYDSAVYPRLVGSAVGLDPIVSMFVIFSGGALFGLPGMILAFPFAGTVKVILARLFGVTNRVETALLLPSVPERHRAALTP